MATIRFLGAAGTVTGSRFLVQAGAAKVLVDAGLFQGMKELRLRNWAPRSARPRSPRSCSPTHTSTTPARCHSSSARASAVRSTARRPRWTSPGSCCPTPGGCRKKRRGTRTGAAGRSTRRTRAPLYTEADALAALRLLDPLRYEARRRSRPG